MVSVVSVFLFQCYPGDSSGSHSPRWFSDIKFKEYSSTKGEFKASLLSYAAHISQNLSPILKSVLNLGITLMQFYIFSHPTKIQGVFIIFKHFQQKFFFSRAFQAPLKSKIKFQGFSRTSRSSTNPGFCSSGFSGSVPLAPVFPHKKISFLSFPTLESGPTQQAFE